VAIDKKWINHPGQLSLKPAYPNPFNPEVTLNFQLAEAAENLKIQVFDLRGKLLATPVNSTFSAGSYALIWDGSSQGGEMLPSGIYILRLSTPEETLFQRVTLLR